MQKSDGIVSVDGHNGFGRYVGHVAMSRAIELARRCGMGLVVVRNSSHFGAGAYYVQLAAQAGMIGFAFTNTPRRVAAYGGLRPIFGTNPIAFGAPLRDGRSVLIDFSTSMMAGSVLRKGLESNEPIREGVAVDEHGKPVTNPEESQFRHAAVWRRERLLSQPGCRNPDGSDDRFAHVVSNSVHAREDAACDTHRACFPGDRRCHTFARARVP